MEYYFADGDQQRGPYTLEALRTVGLKPDVLVWHDGLPEWKPASAMPELASLFESSPTPTMPTPAASPATPVPLAAAVPYQSPAATHSRQNGMAVASLVLGIVGLATLLCYLIGVIPAILAIIFGVIARRDIKRDGGQGYGMATAGLICGSITVGLLFATFLVLAVYFMFHH
jgi:hypothetical protein